MDGNRIKKLSAIILAVLFVLAPFSTVLTGSLSKQSTMAQADTADERSAVFRLEPRVSDGVAIASLESDSMSIIAHKDGDELVFDETKLLGFVASFGDGWSYSETYSPFFPDDPRATRFINYDGSVTFWFNAVSGESVELSVWDSVAVNAAAAELPKLYIQASVPFDEIGKETWVDAEFTLTLGTKEFSSGDFEGTGKVKGRGNSSWTYPKKPYSIKLDSKASLLDIPKTKKYAIVPSYNDGSLMRNYITYKAYQGLIGIDYVTKCEFVDVYLNGEYNGIYILVERIDIEKSKIDIEEADAEHLSGGYLIEKDVNGRIDFQNDIWFHCPYWANQAHDYFVLKAPEPDDAALVSTMKAYLETYMQRIHNSIINGEGRPYTDYVDTSSWVDFIIVQEIAKNIDGNLKTSCWMYKDRDDDHLYMTAPWDFDLAYGLVSWSNADPAHNDGDDCPPCNTYDGFQIVNSSNPWMDTLYDTKPEFRRALMERYTAYRPTLIRELFYLIDEQAAYLSIVQGPNYELWHKNFANGVRNLRNWLKGRVEWLDSQWLIEVDLDYALNITGGELHFSTEGEAAAFEPEMVDGIAVAAACGNDESGVSTSVELNPGDVIVFSCLLEGESELKLLVNGEEALVCSPDKGGMNEVFCRVMTGGVCDIRWVYTGGLDGRALLDEVSVNYGTVMGDVNLDGSVDANDALLILRYALEISSNGFYEALADINYNGSVTTEDALLLLRRVMGIG